MYHSGCGRPAILIRNPLSPGVFSASTSNGLRLQKSRGSESPTADAVHATSITATRRSHSVKAIDFPDIQRKITRHKSLSVSLEETGTSASSRRNLPLVSFTINAPINLYSEERLVLSLPQSYAFYRLTDCLLYLKTDNLRL